MEYVKRAIFSPKSAMYLSNNPKNISKYLEEKGLPKVPKTEICAFLETQNFSKVKYKNEGKTKVSETSKPFLLRGRFFAILQADIMFISKKRQYGLYATPYVLCVIDQLSRHLFLEACPSLRFNHQKQAWTSIFHKIEQIMPNARVSTIISDNGIELKNLLMQDWLKNKGIKLNFVQLRPYRLSKGAAMCESSN